MTTTLHPRPQFTRPDWLDLCGTWAFAYDDDDSGRGDRWHERSDVFDQSIEVPFPPESELSGIGDQTFHPVVWYRRTFTVDTDDPRCWLLHFSAVDYRAEVWVNGQLVVRHEGGHVPFDADITSALVAEGEQVLVVRAEDPPADAHQARGPGQLPRRDARRGQLRGHGSHRGERRAARGGGAACRGQAGAPRLVVGA